MSSQLQRERPEWSSFVSLKYALPKTLLKHDAIAARRNGPGLVLAIGHSSPTSIEVLRTADPTAPSKLTVAARDGGPSRLVFSREGSRKGITKWHPGTGWSDRTFPEVQLEGLAFMTDATLRGVYAGSFFEWQGAALQRWTPDLQGFSYGAISPEGEYAAFWNVPQSDPPTIKIFSTLGGSKLVFTRTSRSMGHLRARFGRAALSGSPVDLALMFGLSASLGLLLASHVALSVGLAKLGPWQRGLVAFLVPPLAPFWGYSGKLHARSLIWIVALLSYLGTRRLAVRDTIAPRVDTPSFE